MGYRPKFLEVTSSISTLIIIVDFPSYSHRENCRFLRFFACVCTVHFIANTQPSPAARCPYRLFDQTSRKLASVASRPSAARHRMTHCPIQRLDDQSRCIGSRRLREAESPGLVGEVCGSRGIRESISWTCVELRWVRWRVHMGGKVQIVGVWVEFRLALCDGGRHCWWNRALA